MNDPQAKAILAVRREYPEPMVVGWRATIGGAVEGHVFASAEDDEAGRWCGTFTICTTGIVRWETKP